MLKYILKRLLWMIPVIVGVSALIFTIMSFVPGDPAEIVLGVQSTPEERQAFRDKNGLSSPFLSQLLMFEKNVFFKLDLGSSYRDSTPVINSIVERLPRTIIIAGGSIFLALLLGIPLGVNAAVHQNKLGDRISMVIALLGVSMPNFWLALMLVLLFSLKLGWLPSLGMGGVAYFILPWISNSMGDLAMQARQSRSSMLEVIRSDYVTTARAKGVSRIGVIMKHALPNALIPVITVAGNTLAGGLAGAMIIENVFSIPGIGLYMVTAINTRDYPAVRGSVIVVAVLFSVVMLLVDIVYSIVDPRIKTALIGGRKRRANNAK